MSNNFWYKSDGNTDILVKHTSKVALYCDFGTLQLLGTDSRQSLSGNRMSEQEAVTV